MNYIPPTITAPKNTSSVLLHACCAPCSSAIIECLLYNGIKPTIFYFNPNIYPREEYEIRKAESIRQASALSLQWIDGDYNHHQWLNQVACSHENDPERGARCQLCFNFRLIATAHCAQQLGIELFTTTLASSRWKNIDQINAAGALAESIVAGTTFWPQNWRKGGLSERRNTLLKEGKFYNQQYCGCEFSIR